MKKQVFRVDSDGYNGAWYPSPEASSRGIIAMLGDSSEDYLAATGAKWLNRQGFHVMAMSPDKKDYGHHNYPLERFGKAIEIRAKTSFAGRRENQSREYLRKSTLHRGGG